MSIKKLQSRALTSIVGINLSQNFFIPIFLVAKVLTVNRNNEIRILLCVFIRSRSDIHGSWRKCTRTIHICDWCICIIRWCWHRHNCRFCRVQYSICYWNVRNILENITDTHVVATVSRLYILQCQFVSVDLFFSW